MRLQKKQWLLMQIVALLVIAGGVFLVKPYLARAISVNPSSMSGSGLPGIPYMVTDCQDLQDISLNLTANYQLANNIDCSDTVNWDAGSGFTPIGQNGNAFNGRLDGRGYTINGLHIDRSSAVDNLGYTGLFAEIGEFGILLDFKVTGATIIGNGHSGNLGAATGGIVARASDGLVDRVHFSGAISIPECDGPMRTGGIVGEAITSGVWSTLSFISSEGTITVTGSNCGQYSTTAGGLIGYDGGYRVSQSFSKMDISLSGDTTVSCSMHCRRIGGLVGTFAALGNETVDSSYYAGSLTIAASVTPYQTYAVGGIFGYAEGGTNIANSFAVPQITVPAACADIDCGTDDRNSGAIGGDDNGDSATGNGNWTGVYFDQDAAGTTYCADGSNATNYRCTAVNTDGLDPDHFKGLTPNEPIASNFDVTTPYWELTNDYPVHVDHSVVYPGAPTNLATTINSTTSISLSWTVSSPAATGYEVLCRIGAGAWTVCNGYTTGSSVMLNGLEPSTQYEFKVVPTGASSYLGPMSASAFGTTATPGFNLVSSCQQLQDIQNDLLANYELAHDIDCSDTITWNGGMGFDPIGLFAPLGAGFEYFTGILKGNNYTIKNLYTDQTNTLDGNFGNGLFASASGALIQDLNIDHPVIIGGVIAATVVPFGSADMTNVHVTDATITGEFQGASGLIGYGGNDDGVTILIARNSFEGTINSSGTNPPGYMSGLIAHASGGQSGGYTITDNYVNATITSANGAALSGGLISAVDSSSAGVVSIARNYVAGSISIAGPFQSPTSPSVPDLGSWSSGAFIGAVFAGAGNSLTIANSFAHMAVAVDGPQDLVGSAIGAQLGGPTTDLSSFYVDTDQAGTSQCIGNLVASCNSISGQPNYFKNNSTNPPLNTWDFSNIWNVSSEFPLFSASVTGGITAIAPERLNPPTTGGGSGDSEAPTISSAADGGSTVNAGSGVGSKATSTPTDEIGVLGAIKHFVRSLPTAVIVAFPYALFGLLFIAALVLLVELLRELRRIRELQVLIHKQRLLAEERDAFWHLAANYLRAPVTLIVGGAEALREANMVDATAGIASLAASLQQKVAQIMAKIEGSTSLQAISQVQPRKVAQVARRAVFIIPVASVAALTLLANYAASSFRNMNPGFIGYATQVIGFVIATILFYWVLSLLTSGKGKRKAAEELLDRQTSELANARHELISETANSLNPDLTKLEGMLHALPAVMAASATGALSTLGEGTSRLRDIVNSFNMLIKVQEGTGAVTATPGAATVDLTSLMAKTRAKLTSQIAAKNVRVEAPAIPLAVHAEADLANQVLESIIANAVDYSPANGTVKVEARRLQDAIQVRISDQGQGIDKKQLDHLFQPFVRTDGKSAMDMSHGGFGINLYLDKLIMEQLGGTISAVSTPGEGTAFTMTWPT